MSVWKSELGEINGSKENSFAGSVVEIIPNSTTARAFIKNILTKRFQNDKGTTTFYQVTWKLIDGDFKDQEVNQKLHIFDTNPKKAFRAQNMLMRFFKIFNIEIPPSFNISDEGLSVFNSKVAGIRIFEWETDDGKCGNWVGEVDIDNNQFETKTGKKMERKLPKLVTVDKTDIGHASLEDDMPFF